MFNPLENPDFIRVGHTHELGLYIETQNIMCNVRLPVGTPIALFYLFQANNVRHYDLEDNLINNAPLYDMFREVMDALA